MKGPFTALKTAARTRATPLLEITPDELAEVMAVTFTGTFQA
ncbi:hypothetical protein [Amycolatopsis sulphurea]|nr:hypothetical protein [Amycolatopsis sulphurea]